MQRAMHYSVIDGDCIVYMGALTAGYGIFQVDGRTVRIHEWAWEQHNGGPAPEGMDLHHTCGRKPCWKIEHLKLLPAAEHCLLHGLRGFGKVNAEKTECVNGHEFSEENTYIDALGKRHCRTCRAATARRLRTRRKAT